MTLDRTILVNSVDLDAKVRAALAEAGADTRSADATTRALMHASKLGVDSHGVRLTPHYCKVLRGGRVNGRPNMQTARTAPGASIINADNALGHLAAYEAVELATSAARETGVAAVGIRASSHFGAAGAYAVAGAEAGCVTIAMTNSDPGVSLHGGAESFHGTNPIAAAAPLPGEKPWLLDMATSAVPMNRVLLYRVLGLELPDAVAADGSGRPTRDPGQAEMLLPVGGAFGFKGAGLAGLVTILSAVLVGAKADPFIAPMEGEDVSTPRDVGQFILAFDPAFFAGRSEYEIAMRSYVDALRATRSREGERAMAPGDREWATERERTRTGIPVDFETADFLKIS